MMVEPAYTLLQVNIMGLRGHIKIVISRYLQQNEADIVSWKEPTHIWVSNRFERFTPIS